MVEKTTLQLSTELKDTLDALKQRGDTYEDVISRLIPDEKNSVDGEVLLSMSRDEYISVMSRQTWESAKDILRASIVPVYRKTKPIYKKTITCRHQSNCLGFEAVEK
jgi:hypothetical protein